MNAESIARWRSSSLAANHGESNGRSAQTRSRSATIAAGGRPDSATRACTSEPRVELSARALPPPWRSAIQRSGQSVSVCSVDGLRVTVCSSPNSGSAVLRSARPCHWDGSAPGTPAAARRANCAAACARSSSATSPSGAQTTARNRPTTAAGESTGGAGTGAGVSAASVDPPALDHCTTSVTKEDGSAASSPSSRSTAVIISRRRARPIAAISRRRSSASTGAWAQTSSPSPSSASSRRWVPSTPPRGAVLGHNPSCTPAMITVCQSRPSAACGLSTATVSRAAVLSVTGASCRAATWSSRPGTEAPVVRET